MDSKTDLYSVSLPENNASQKTSQAAAWFIWLAHFAFIARQKIFARGRIDFDTIDTYAAIDVLVVSFLMLILLFNRKTTRFLSVVYKSSLFWLFAYYFVCALSIMWSLRPAYSLYRSIECLVFITSLGVALLYCPGFEKAERKVLFLSLLSVFVQMGAHMRGGGALSLGVLHTNAYSASAAMIFVYCVGEYLALAKKKLSINSKRRKRLFIYGVFSLAFLALGTSSGSNVAALFGIVVILFAQRKMGLMTFIFFAVLLLFFLGGGLDPLMEVLFPGKTEQGIATLGGRTKTWTYYAARIAESPLWGHGLGVSPTKGGGVWMAYSHNFILSILIGTGFLGLTIFIFFPFKLAVELIRSSKRKIEGAAGAMGALAAGFVNSLSMPMIADRWATASFAFFSILFLFLLHVYPKRLQPSKSSFHENPIAEGSR